MNKASCALFVILLLNTSFKQPPAYDKGRKVAAKTIIDKTVQARIDATLKSFVDSGTIAGVSALVIEKDKEVYFNAFGYSNQKEKTAMDRNTIVRIYSMTKPVTGVALMQLYEKGAFKLDDPLAKYVPEFAAMKVYKGVDASGKLVLEPARRPITIRDLTRHTAGFAVGTDLPGLSELVKKTDALNPRNTLGEMVKKLAALPLQFHPGDQWAYGPSVDVQAFLVERLSQKPFDQYLKENIFDPLGMINTGYVVAQKDLKRLAAMYRKTNGSELSPIPDDENTYNIRDWQLKPGGFGLTSTIDDYMKFTQMLVNKGRVGKATILKPETIRLMATNHLSDTISQRMWLPSKGQVGFGIDFAVRTRPTASKDENKGVVGEFFWDGAASTLFWIDPVNHLTAVLFVQIFPFDRTLHKRFRDAVYGEYTPG
ncbi:class A beta-lactamase-related serine hydrolase [Segetibacter sp. 3557_3]|uniref:serine hydrolase domain-containing protein n=1 Tax=Segetibacter sp. 3557_3 TaxID=2547429 RepID=UPI001058E8AC|nr:serine hydrolase domain-containing protein [Segetibacter sp. 3557_3]TDH24597.1 class A beta-lactamase-related serine hydrolase [Segetibacter sp. 3557_3]